MVRLHALTLTVGVISCTLGGARHAHAEPDRPTHDATWCNNALAARDERALHQAQKRIDHHNASESERAAAHCVLGGFAELRADDDAREHWQQAIALQPNEPYYEYRAGLYWASLRGSFAPALEAAEVHFHAALHKLQVQPEGHRRDWLQRATHTQLRLLYQRDGLPLTPWKGWRAAESDPAWPGVGLTAGIALNNSVPTFLGDSALQRFSWEAAYANSGLRAGGTQSPLSELERWRIARSALHTTASVGAVLRQNPLGRLSVQYWSTHGKDAQITNLYLPQPMNDTQISRLRFAYERVFPLPYAFDLGVGATYQRNTDRGFFELMPESEQEYSVYAAQVSLSRTLGPGRFTLAGDYTFADIEAVPPTAPGEGERGVWWRAVHLQYSRAGAFSGNAFAWGATMPYGVPGYGWAAYAGYQEHEDQYGLRTQTRRRFYGGGQWDAVNSVAVQLEAALLQTITQEIRADDIDLREVRDPFLSFSSARLLTVGKWRLRDATREQPSAMQLGNLLIGDITLALPVAWEFGLDGPDNWNPVDTANHKNDYAHVSVGSEIWLRSLGIEPLGGGLLFTAGLTLDHYYSLEKTLHSARVSAQLGW